MALPFPHASVATWLSPTVTEKATPGGYGCAEQGWRRCDRTREGAAGIAWRVAHAANGAACQAARACDAGSSPPGELVPSQAAEGLAAGPAAGPAARAA